MSRTRPGEKKKALAVAAAVIILMVAAMSWVYFAQENYIGSGGLSHVNYPVNIQTNESGEYAILAPVVDNAGLIWELGKNGNVHFERGANVSASYDSDAVLRITGNGSLLIDAAVPDPRGGYLSLSTEPLNRYKPGEKVHWVWCDKHDLNRTITISLNATNGQHYWTSNPFILEDGWNRMPFRLHIVAA